MADEILHNLPIDSNPSDSVKIAMGTETTPATNITLANFYTLLMSKLGFFKVSNLFSEIFGNPTATDAARANLSVPSVLEMQTADNLKANKSNVIEKDSTIAFTPTIATHPVNKGYIDGRYRFGTFKYLAPWNTGSRLVTISPPLANSNYHVDLTIATVNGGRGMYPPNVTNKTVNSFTINVDPENDSIMVEPNIEWKITMK